MRRKYCTAIGYTPPETTKSHVREFLVGEETLDRYLGSSIHIFLPHVPRLDFACLIPKGDFATMCLLGEEIDEELVQSFMKTPEFRECLPPEVIVQECSRCYPRLNICGAGEPFADRTVAIGDSGITRLCKDGIGTAYRTAKAAAALIKPGSRSPKGCSTAFRWRGGPIIPALPVPPTACRAPHPFRCASTTARGTWSTGRGPVAGSGVENAVFARDPLGDPWFCSVLHLDGHWVYPIVCGDYEGVNTVMLSDNQGVPHPLDYMFQPRSVAVVGISADLPKIWIRRLYLDSLIQSGYPGQIYLVNPRGGEMAGLPIYRSLKEIPGPVDHVVISVPARYTPEIMEECGRMGVKVVHVFASGYAETGEPERVELQDRLVAIARQGNMRIIGPNCLGIYYPAGKIGLIPDFPMEPGPIGFLCQSGGNVAYMVRHAVARGLRFSKIVSYGNACDINECDLLDYFAADPETKVIAAYIEGVRDGRRLMEALAKAASAKPTVVLKGGYTAGGSRAAASHTGSLAGADAIWDGLLIQVGAIRTHSIEEMVDILVALLRVRPPGGFNTCAVGNGGGASVMATDELERAGLRLPPIPGEIREGLKDFIDLANSMLRNPIDISPLATVVGFEYLMDLGSRRFEELLREKLAKGPSVHWARLNAELKKWPGLDLVIYHHGFDVSPMPLSELMVNCIVGPMALAAKACELPNAIVLHSMGNDHTWQSSAELRGLCVEFGLPLFLSMRGAATAMRALIDYNLAHPGKLAALQS